MPVRFESYLQTVLYLFVSVGVKCSRRFLWEPILSVVSFTWQVYRTRARNGDINRIKIGEEKFTIVEGLGR